MTTIRAHVLVSGRVQGVFFREYTRRQALAYGVSGWVRNLADGRVEAVFEGDEQAVRKVLRWCRQGSPNAFVTEVTVDYHPFAGEFTAFHIRN